MTAGKTPRRQVDAAGNGAAPPATDGPVGSPRIGARLKHARLMLGLNLTELGEKAGVTESYLSKLENNRSQASMATLHRLTSALGTNISALFAPSLADDEVVLVVRAGQRAKLVTGGPRSLSRITLERMVPSGPGQLLQINVHVIPAGSGNIEPISHDGQEFGYILSGTVELVVNDVKVALGKDDAFYFESARQHSYRNVGDAEARVLWVNTPPTF